MAAGWETSCSAAANHSGRYSRGARRVAETLTSRHLPLRKQFVGRRPPAAEIHGEYPVQGDPNARALASDVDIQAYPTYWKLRGGRE